jgi:hypothetical protein
MPFGAAVKETTWLEGRDNLERRHLGQRLFTRGRSVTRAKDSS